MARQMSTVWVRVCEYDELDVVVTRVVVDMVSTPARAGETVDMVPARGRTGEVVEFVYEDILKNDVVKLVLLCEEEMRMMLLLRWR